MRPGSAVAAVVLTLLFAPDAGADPTWLPQGTISAPGEENREADVAVAPDGTAIVVWQRADCKGGNESHTCANGRVHYSVRPPGGVFSPGAEMPGQGPFASNKALPRVAVDGAGNAIAAWSGTTPAGQRIHYSLRPAGGDFSNAKQVADPLTEGDYYPTLAVAPGGRAVVLFQRLIGGKGRVGFAIGATGADFGSADTVPGDNGNAPNFGPSVEIDAAGNALAAWARPVAAEGVFLQYATLGAQAIQFSAPATIENAGRYDLAMAPSGAAVLVWNKYSSGDDFRYSFRPPGGAFGAPQTLVEPDQPSSPFVDVADDGGVVLAWTSFEGESHPRWSAAPFGGPFAQPASLPGVQGGVQALEVSHQGTALLLFGSGIPVVTLNAALRPPGGTFGPPVPIPSPPQGADRFDAAADFDEQGNAAAAWNARHPEDATPHDVPMLAAGLDAAGPRINALEVPARARDDRAVDLSMAASDVWTPVIATGFDFGDGAKGAGPVARHRFRAGRHTVVASATDAVGNTSTASAAVQVRDVTRPLLKGLKVIPRRFFALRGRVAHASRRYGARIRFRLSEPARVILSIQEARRGVRVRVRGKRRKCVPRTPRNLRRGGRRCIRFAKVRRLVRRNGRRGRNSVRLSGRFHRKRLRAGRHRVVAIAIDRAKRRSRPARAGFRVIPRRR